MADLGLRKKKKPQVCLKHSKSNVLTDGFQNGLPRLPRGRSSACRLKYQDGLKFLKQRLVEALRAERDLQLQPRGPGGARTGHTAKKENLPPAF